MKATTLHAYTHAFFGIRIQSKNGRRFSFSYCTKHCYCAEHNVEVRRAILLCLNDGDVTQVFLLFLLEHRLLPDTLADVLHLSRLVASAGSAQMLPKHGYIHFWWRKTMLCDKSTTQTNDTPTTVSQSL